MMARDITACGRKEFISNSGPCFSILSSVKVNACFGGWVPLEEVTALLTGVVGVGFTFGEGCGRSRRPS